MQHSSTAAPTTTSTHNDINQQQSALRPDQHNIDSRTLFRSQPRPQETKMTRAWTWTCIVVFFLSFKPPRCLTSRVVSCVLDTSSTCSQLNSIVQHTHHTQHTQHTPHTQHTQRLTDLQSVEPCALKSCEKCTRTQPSQQQQRQHTRKQPSQQQQRQYTRKQPHTKLESTTASS